MIEDYIKFNENILSFYSPYNILRIIDKRTILNSIIYPEFTELYENINRIEIKVKSQLHIFIYKNLTWDSKFNGFPTFKLISVLFKHRNSDILNTAISIFRDEYIKIKDYWFIEIPSEDIFLIQSLNHCCFRLIESRLNHYIEDISNYNFERYKVRHAKEEDIPILKKVAMKNINNFDRFHADFCIDNQFADLYLATYVENAVKGFCDAVLVPNIPDIAPKAFMALSLLKEDSLKLSHKIGRLQLSAVDPELKGWYIKLASESIFYARSEGTKSMLVTTQATNRAAFHSSEKQGFKLGGVTHVLSFHKKNGDGN